MRRSLSQDRVRRAGLDEPLWTSSTSPAGERIRRLREAIAGRRRYIEILA
jgi:hypothetical protein